MAERETPDSMEAGRSGALRATQSLAFLVGMGVCLTLSLGFAVGMFERANGAPAIGSGERLNPNEASPASLMRLPQIGAARAQAIVAHRNRVGSQEGRVRVFERADDLQQIKGIGPAMVEDLRPWLQFDNPPQDANESPMR